jgi:hypothetical protein
MDRVCRQRGLREGLGLEHAAGAQRARGPLLPLQSALCCWAMLLRSRWPTDSLYMPLAKTGRLCYMLGALAPSIGDTMAS